MTQKSVRIKIKSIMYNLLAADLYINIVGEEKAQPEDTGETIEYYTEGVISDKGDIIELSYYESDDTGMGNTKTSLVFSKHSPNELNMVRSGDNTANMMFSGTEKRRTCAYTAAGLPMSFVIYTRSVDNRLTASGGKLKLDYVIEIQGCKTQRTCFSLQAYAACDTEES